jgi:TolB-like protein/class 3 adenylate cyclase
MADEGFKRKLAAILSADVEGYSRLMDDDEEATVRTLTAYRTAINDLVQQYRGRVVDAPGDNILAEFSSVVDAVNGAVEIQRELAERNAELPYNRKMEFRIGVNLGDVIEEEGRIYGDGVNIAARVEAMSQAGGICISGRAYDQVENKLGLEYENLGEHQVKNITRPIRVFRVLSFPGAAAHRVIKAKKIMRKKWLWVAVSTVLILLITFIGLYWKYFYLPTPKTIDPENKMAFDLPKGPSIAVLPFDNISGDPEQDYFCYGITENITSALAHVRQLFVIARNSAIFYKGKSIKVQQIGIELGVDYVIEGSFQKSGDQIRITVQLVETISGNHIWSDIYDRNLHDIFQVQDEITIEILKAIGIKIGEGEQFWDLYQGVTDLNTFIKCLKSHYLFEQMNIESNNLSRKICLEIIETNNKIPYIYVTLGFTYIIDIFFGVCKSPVVCVGQATEAAKKALSLEPNYHKAHQLVGTIFLLRKEHEKAIDELKRAVNINPNNERAYLNLGIAYYFYGRPIESIDYINKSIKLNPRPPSDYYVHLGNAYTIGEEYEKGIEALKKGAEIEPNNLLAHIGLAATYGALEREKEARAEAKEVLTLNPNFSVEDFIKVLPFKDPVFKKRYAEYLQKAGLK